METKKDLSCDIVKDLLPVYCDGQASKDSVEVIKTHFTQCDDCKKIYEEMNEELDIEKQEGVDREIKEMKKFLNITMLKMGIGFLAVGLVITGLVVGLAIGIIPAKSKDATITYKVYKEKMPVHTEVNKIEEQEKYCVDFTVALPEGKILNYRRVHIEEEYKHDGATYKLFSVMKFPFADRGKKPNEADLGIRCDEPFSEDDVMTFEFRDKTVTYNLKELAEEAGLQ